MSENRADWIDAGSLEEVRAKGMVVVKGRDCPILVAADRERVFAVDNRCPHMGFPLHRGSLEDGVITCHWHHARFDASSGCTFDLWADDVPTATVRIENGRVLVSARCRPQGGADAWRQRLQDGMSHAVGLAQGKAILGAGAHGVEAPTLVRDVALFGVTHREDWSTGLTILTALANVLDRLGEEERFLALYQGSRHVANDCRGRAPRPAMMPLDGSAADPATLRRWLRRWTAVRHRTGAERTLLTALTTGVSPVDVMEMLMAAATDRAYADGGHTLDFINKAAECLDRIGWDHAKTVLPSVVDDLVGARGADEETSWRHPDDLIARLDEIFVVLPALVDQAARSPRRFEDHEELARTLLSDDPQGIIDALCAAMKTGARPTDLSRALALAAATRIAQFGTANEASDWDTAHHSFTYCNALHALLSRIETQAGGPLIPWEGVRGVFHGAMTVYLNRYLNVPPARLDLDAPDRFADLASEAPALLRGLLEAFDQQHQVDAAARLATRYLQLGHPTEALIETLGKALLREDAGFHTYQLFEASLRQYAEWGDCRAGHIALIAFVRFLAAHCPTRRAQHQTASIALRLHRGGTVYEDEEEPAV